MRYLYWLRLYAFPLGLNQGRWNMLHSEYIQLKDRRMTTDPKDAGIARLTTELRVYMDAAEAHAVETMRQRDRAEKAEAERDAALAQVAGQKAVLSEILEWSHRQFGLYPDWHDRLRKVLGQFDGDAGLSERDRRDAQMRAEGRKEGLREAAGIADQHNDAGYSAYSDGWHHCSRSIASAILAAAEKEASP